MQWFRKHGLYVVWVAVLMAILGSLYFSNVLHFPPCVLCWYQRIALYPLAVIIPIGILKKDKLLPFYILALSGIGLVIALYHNLLYYDIIPVSIAPCVQGISCTTRFIHWFGFLSIPLLSLINFIFIFVATFIYRRERITTQ